MYDIGLPFLVLGNESSNVKLITLNVIKLHAVSEYVHPVSHVFTVPTFQFVVLAVWQNKRSLF